MMSWAATREAPAPPRAHEDTTRGQSSHISDPFAVMILLWEIFGIDIMWKCVFWAMLRGLNYCLEGEKNETNCLLK